jgi:hypothetical protein
MSSLNEILDAPMTPEQKQQKQQQPKGARFRTMFARFARRKAPAVAEPMGQEDDDDDSTLSPERFVTTVLINDGTSVVEDDQYNNANNATSVPPSVEEIKPGEKVEEVAMSARGLEDALPEDVPSTEPAVAAITTALSKEDQEGGDDDDEEEGAMDASQIMENLNETSQFMDDELNDSTEVSLIAFETTFLADKKKRRSPVMKHLLQSWTAGGQFVEESYESPSNREDDAAPNTIMVPPVVVDPSAARLDMAESSTKATTIPIPSPTTTDGAPNADDDDRYAVIHAIPSSDNEEFPQEEEEELILESEDIVDPADDRYAIAADACSFCDSFFRTPAAAMTEHEMAALVNDILLEEEVVVTEDRDDKEEVGHTSNAPFIDKYAPVVPGTIRALDHAGDAKENKNVGQRGGAVIHPQGVEKSSSTTTSSKKKKRFALFRRRKQKPHRSISQTVPPAEQAVSSKKPLQGILKTPTKSFAIDESVAAVGEEDDFPTAPQEEDGASASTVTSHEDDVDPLLDRLKQQQRGLDPGLHYEQRQRRLEP